MTDTLATRLAERNRLRELRAERLARLRAAPAPADDAEAALEDFLRAVGGAALPAAAPAPAPAPEPGAVLPFRSARERPAAPPSDLDRLPGAGPGLVWALERAGLHSLADLAPLAAGELAARLGPVGRLVPAEAWIAAAREAAPAP